MHSIKQIIVKKVIFICNKKSYLFAAKRFNPFILFTNAYNRCLNSVAILQRFDPLVTNGSICVAFHLCNAQKCNAYLSVGIGVSNAYMDS
jgi:hypothetical protein